MRTSVRSASTERHSRGCSRCVDSRCPADAPRWHLRRFQQIRIHDILSTSANSPVDRQLRLPRVFSRNTDDGGDIDTQWRSAKQTTDTICASARTMIAARAGRWLGLRGLQKYVVRILLAQECLVIKHLYNAFGQQPPPRRGKTWAPSGAQVLPMYIL